MSNKKLIAMVEMITLIIALMLTCANSQGSDFDGDGKSDILLYNTTPTTGVVAVWLMNGTTIKSGGYVSTTLTGWNIAGVGDFDGDGKSDILLYNNSTTPTTGAVTVWLMNGITINSGGYVSTTPTGWNIAGVGDFDGDGKSDILLQNSLTGAIAVWLMNGTTVKGGGYVVSSLDASWQIKGVGDFDGDGKSDILLRNSITGAVVVWLLNGAAIKGGGYVATSLNASWQIKGVGDFDGDGKSDILLYNSSTTPTTGAVVVWLMNGATIKSGGYVSTSLDSSWQIAGVGDFDGDKKSDILLYNTTPTTGMVAVWLMNGTTIKSGGYVSTSLDSSWQIR